MRFTLLPLIIAATAGFSCLSSFAQIDYSYAPRHEQIVIGGGMTDTDGGLTIDDDGTLHLDDNSKIHFGADVDFKIFFNSASSTLAAHDGAANSMFSVSDAGTTGNLTATAGLWAGVDDTSSGVLSAYGNGDTVGGQLRLFNGDDEDGSDNAEYTIIEAEQLGRINVYSEDRVNYESVVAVGMDDGAARKRGNLAAYGSGTTAGGVLALYNGDTDDTTTEYFIFEPQVGTLEIGTDDNANALQLTAAGALTVEGSITAGSGATLITNGDGTLKASTLDTSTQGEITSSGAINGTKINTGNGDFEIGQDLATTNSVVFANVDAGVADTSRGILKLFGNDAALGGQALLYNGADDDGTTEYFVIEPNAGVLEIGTDDGASTVTISAAGEITASAALNGTEINTGLGDFEVGQDLQTSDAVTFATLDTGQGANELYDMDQNVLQASAVTFATVDTGQGANELYDMDQNVLQASAVTFATVDTGHGANELYDMDQHVLQASAVTFATLDTGEGANELFNMNQDVESTDAVTFLTLNTGNGAYELFAMNQDVESTDDVTFDDVIVGKLYTSDFTDALIVGAIDDADLEDDDTGLSSNAGADEFVIFKTGGDAGMSIITDNDRKGRIYFGDPDNTTRGRIDYDHNVDTLKLWVNNQNTTSMTSTLTSMHDDTEFEIDVIIDDGFINFGTDVINQISSGAITVSSTYNQIRGEGNVDDDLATINGGTEGDIVIFNAYHNSQDITVVETGNIETPGSSVVMDDVDDMLTLIYDGTDWKVLSFSDNTDDS